AALPLDRETSLTVTGSEGYSCVVNITSGRADVSDATCPDRLCVHQKRISREGETIVCLPARIVIEIKGTEAGTGLYDGISR
ncbi:MAG TPA: NusG domain II-containing protein, partial [Lachnospiraceae bacterium]|nr:NusG domain II-containing protein [Lachnospiraceae bacterium]